MEFSNSKGIGKISLKRTGFYTAHDGKVHKEGACQAEVKLIFRECRGCCCESYVNSSVSVTQIKPNCPERETRKEKDKDKDKFSTSVSSAEQGLLGAEQEPHDMSHIPQMSSEGKAVAATTFSELHASGVVRERHALLGDSQRGGKEGKKRKGKSGDIPKEKSRDIPVLGKCPAICPTKASSTCSGSPVGDGVDEEQVQKRCELTNGESCMRPMQCGKWIQLIDAVVTVALKLGGTIDTVNQLGGLSDSGNCYDRSTSGVIKGCCELARGDSMEARELRKGAYLPARPKQPAGAP